jgi:hypothetical protein
MQVTLYFVDWERLGRRQVVEVRDPATFNIVSVRAWRSSMTVLPNDLLKKFGLIPGCPNADGCWLRGGPVRDVGIQCVLALPHQPGPQWRCRSLGGVFRLIRSIDSIDCIAILLVVFVLKYTNTSLSHLTYLATAEVGEHQKATFDLYKL